MRIGLRLLLGFFLVLGLSLFVVLRVLLDEVKPGTRLAMEDSLIDAAYTLAQLATPDMKAGTMADGFFARSLQGLHTARPGANIGGFSKDRIDYRISITDAQGIVRFDTQPEAVGQDHSRWNDVVRTLRGEYGARSSPASPDDVDNTVMHVAAPIRDGDRIIGVLTVSRPNQRLQPYIDRSEQRILRWSWALLGLSLLIGVLFLVVLAYAWVFDKLGFILATALMVVPIARFFGGSWKQAVTGGVGLGIGLFILFDRLLDVALPTGLWLNNILG